MKKLSQIIASLAISAFIPFCLSACSTARVRDPGKDQCVNIMQRIETAKHTMALAYGLDDGSELSPVKVDGLAQFMLGGSWSANKCPAGGTYTIGKIGEWPACSKHGKLRDVKAYY